MSKNTLASNGDSPNGNGRSKVNTQGQLPSWFYEGALVGQLLKDPAAFLSYLDGLRRDMYNALSLYQIHVRYASTVIISLLTVAVTILSIRAWTGISPQMSEIMGTAAGALMFAGSAIGIILLFVITRYHNLFVATLLHATQAHSVSKLDSFLWFQDTVRLLKRKAKDNPNIQADEFVHWRTWHRMHSHFWYSLLIAVLTTLCFIAGIWLSWNIGWYLLLPGVVLPLMGLMLVLWIWKPSCCVVRGVFGIKPVERKNDK